MGDLRAAQAAQGAAQPLILALHAEAASNSGGAAERKEEDEEASALRRFIAQARVAAARAFAFGVVGPETRRVALYCGCIVRCASRLAKEEHRA